MHEEATQKSCERCGSEVVAASVAMAAALLWPAPGTVSLRRSLSRSLIKGTLVGEASRYIHSTQRRFLASKPVTALATKPGKKAATKPRTPAGDVSDLVWTSRAGWACVKNCGACCVLDKGPDYPPIEEVLPDPAEAALYRSMVGPDGWCVNYDKPTRSCRIHAERPRFCRVEPEMFLALYGIQEKDMDKEARGFCQDQIRSVYGGRSKELKTFQRVVRNLKKSLPGDVK